MKYVVFWNIKPSSYLTGDTLSIRYRAQPDNAMFKVFTAVTMKNAVFWDIRTHFEPHSRHIKSPLESPAG
jgi:hypothetical protein